MNELSGWGLLNVNTGQGFFSHEIWGCENTSLFLFPDFQIFRNMFIKVLFDREFFCAKIVLKRTKWLSDKQIQEEI